MAFTVWKCPNTEFFLVRIFPHSDWIRSDAVRSISPYSRKNSVYGYFSRSDFQRLLNSCANHKSSHPEVFCKNGVPKNFAKFTGKHLCQSPESQSPATVLKKSLWHSCFPENFAKFLSATFFLEHLQSLHLKSILTKHLPVWCIHWSNRY